MNPFWIIPFAIVAAMLTGVLIGTPTLRARGLFAIVTLGFGEIIEIVANNLDGVTGGPAGTPGVIPQFSVHLFGVSYGWTGTVLPYYYLILGVAVIFTVAPAGDSGDIETLTEVAKLPGFAQARTARHQVLDLAGDGQQDCVVLEWPDPGFYKRTDDQDCKVSCP